MSVIVAEENKIGDTISETRAAVTTINIPSVVADAGWKFWKNIAISMFFFQDAAHH
jgi:hypothetical protein